MTIHAVNTERSGSISDWYYMRFEHIQPALRRLHWLPVRKRVYFKLATLVRQALHGLLPSDFLPTPVAAIYTHLPQVHVSYRLAHTAVSVEEALV